MRVLRFQQSVLNNISNDLRKTNLKPMSNQHNITHVFRLQPEQDIKQSILQYVNEHHIQAGWIITCVGSLTDFHIRFANANEGSKATGHYEILSLSGTVSIYSSHLHICIADAEGKTIGGHLLDGCIIYTTAEIVIGSSDQFMFTREKDGTTPWKELQIIQK